MSSKGFIASMEASVEDLRTKLPIAFVLEDYGHYPAGESYGRLHYINPWREDEHPSLDVFISDKGEQRAGDFAANWQGSVIDMIMKMDECDSQAAILKARTLYGTYLNSDWKGPSLEERKRDDGEIFEGIRDVLYSNGDPNITNYEVVYDLLTTKVALTSDALEGWGMKVDPSYGTLMVPYPDDKAIRLRYQNGEKRFIKGSQPGLYYKPGRWFSDKPVLLVEGESDTWAATAYAPDYMVVGIPGVGTRPDKVAHSIVGRELVIFFDGDDAGRKGAEVWAEWAAAHGVVATIVPTPEGRDISELTKTEFDFLLGQRRSMVLNTSKLANLGNGYGYPGKGQAGDRYVSNWVLNITRQVKLPGDITAYEGDFCLSGRVVRRVVLNLAGMSHNNIHEWASQYGGSWTGTESSNRDLAMLLSAESYSLPVVAGTNKPGLHHSTFTWPFGNVGPSEVLPFEDLNQPTSMAEFYNIHITTNSEEGRTMRELLNTYDHKVLIPFMSWLAIAPLRDLYTQFPIMFVTGQSGSGKTTLTKNLLSKFSGTLLDTSLSGTPHSVLATVSGTNAFPVWFDEYRQGSRRDTMQTLAQVMRDAYTKSASGRGGMDNNNMSRLFRYTTNAPIVITGEDYADEQSHRDRIIKLFLPQDGKRAPISPDAKCLAWGYFVFLTGNNYYGRVYTDNPPAILPSRIEGLSDRMAYNVGVLDAGYALLDAYCQELDIALPPKDWSNILSQMIEDESGDIVLDVLRAASEHRDGDDAVWYDDSGNTYVHSSSLYSLVDRNSGLGVLPWTSGHTATKALCTQYNGAQVTVTHPTRLKRMRVVKLPFDIRERNV